MLERKVIIAVTISGLLLSIGILVFILFLVKNVKQKIRLIKVKHDLDKMTAVVQAQEQERTKISRNLHDEVGSVLAMTNRNLKGLYVQIEDTASYKEDIGFTIEMLEQAVAKIRTISHEMLPHFLMKFGLPRTLERLIQQTEKILGAPCTFQTNFDESLHMSQKQLVNFYAIVTEITNNLLKHAHPHSVHFYLKHTGSDVQLNVEHDGVAISQTDYEHLLTNSDGMGLVSISIRLTMINGTLLYNRNSLGGTIELSMPLLENEDSYEKIDT